MKNSGLVGRFLVMIGRGRASKKGWSHNRVRLKEEILSPIIR